MDILIVLLPLSLGLATVFLVLFQRAVRSGQFDDLDDAAVRSLMDEDRPMQLTRPESEDGGAERPTKGATGP